ncbi:hypothetical protein H0H93_011763 [Arthromyces matolae]|nr:hypothetical protein H0H93_011763 [Arthromyces matolae]
MVGFAMILDGQKGEDIALDQVQRLEERERRSNDVAPPPYAAPPLPPRKAASDSVSSAKYVLPPQPPSIRPSSLPPPTAIPPYVNTGNDPISGTFYVNPAVALSDLHGKSDRGKKKNFHAWFRTRKGSISLNLGTVGDAISSKANVWVSTRHGDINIKLLPTSTSKPPMGLQACTRGDFSGAFQASSHHGRLDFLPGFASKMKVMKRTKKEALVMVDGDARGAQEVNFCELKTRHGKVVIGLSDFDKYESSPGFWKR